MSDFLLGLYVLEYINKKMSKNLESANNNTKKNIHKNR